MSELSALLERENIRKVLVVDDAFDTVPKAQDLLIEDSEWTHFFEDLDESDRAALNALYPGFDGERADRLRESDDFIAALWRNAGTIRAELLEPLFALGDHPNPAIRDHLKTGQ
jgi:hypothetical protein